MTVETVNVVLGNDLFASQLAGGIGAEYIPVPVSEYPEGDQKPTIKSILSTSIEEYLKEKNVLLAFRDDRFNPDSNKYHMRNWLILGILKKIKPRRIGVLAPYMHYSRQNKAFMPGEPYSLETIGMLYETFPIDYFITVNSHVRGRPEGENLDSFFPNTIVHDIGTADLFAERIKQFNIENPIVVSPDKGSLQMARELGEALGCPDVNLSAEKDLVSDKKTISAGKVTRDDVEGMHPIIRDDLTVSGGTLYRASSVLKELGSLNPYIVVDHIYTRKVVERLSNTDVIKILTTDSFYLKPELKEEFHRYVEELTLVPTISDYISNYL